MMAENDWRGCTDVLNTNVPEGLKALHTALDILRCLNQVADETLVEMLSKFTHLDRAELMAAKFTSYRFHPCCEHKQTTSHL